MGYYISTTTIKEAYNELTISKFNNASILHIYLILKGIGFDNLEYKDLDLIKENGLQSAYRISGLFSVFEKLPLSHDFINPFAMPDWGTNPTELLKKWVRGRIKNNIIGGAINWRKIILQDDEKVKFAYNYIDEIKSLTLKDYKINLPALAIWANRFTVFDSPVSLTALCKQFISDYNIVENELSALYTYTNNLRDIKFSESLHNCAEIRQLIGAPSSNGNWITSIKNSDIVLDDNLKFYILNKGDKNMKEQINKEFITTALKDFNQIILSGVPGTSKSYYCQKVAENFDKTLHVQFHPQYTYQQFIGGYFVNKSDVEFRTGVFYDFVKEAEKNASKKYLMIIDEINRANTSQVFGETIQCLDRNSSVEIMIDNKLQSFSIPKNLYIIGTMNTTDKTVGALDFALRRRFLTVYCPIEESLLVELCPAFDQISISDILSKINKNILEVLKNKEYCIGHALFLNDNYCNDGKYNYNIDKLSLVFNYKILPMIEEYCYGDMQKVEQIVGDKLSHKLNGEEFKKEIKEFVK